MRILKPVFIILCLFSFLYPEPQPAEADDASADGVFNLPDGNQLSGVVTLRGKLAKGTAAVFSATLGAPGAAACFKSESTPAVWLAFETGTQENPCSLLTAFTLSSDTSRAGDSACSRSPLLSVKTATQNGLALGMSQASLLKKLGGKPSKKTPEYVVYFYENFRAYTAAEKARIKAETEQEPPRGEWSYQNLIARFKDKKMEYLRVSLTTETEN